MSVTVDYLVVYSEEMDLMELLTDMLKNALKDVEEEPPDEEELRDLINICYTKRQEDSLYICGFSVEFDSAEERTEEQLGELIANFSGYVVDCKDKGIEHLLKLNDPHLRRTLRAYGDEIFEIEMKLREALSLIFIDTYGEDFYNLLKDSKVNPTKDCIQDHMEECYQNEFFFLTFSSYIQINERKDTNLERVVECIGQAKDFEGLKRMIATKEPITETEYSNFLEEVKKFINRIEDLRNCIAHNRPIPDEIEGAYETAKESLWIEINKFRKKLANCEVSDETETQN